MWIGTLLVLAALMNTSPANAELVHGYALFTFGSWDFSDSMMVGEHDGDLRIIYVVDPPIGWQYTCENGAVARTVTGSFEEVAEAPADLSTYSGRGPALPGPVYVLRTGDGNYVKYHITFVPEPFIEYVYQTNGTRYFVDAVAIRESTWGAVKAVYRTR